MKLRNKVVVITGSSRGFGNAAARALLAKGAKVVISGRKQETVDHAFCRMYRSAPAAWEGFGKNLYAIFGRNLPLYLFIWLWLGIVFLSPWLMLAGALLRGWPASLLLAGMAIAIATILWTLTAWRLRLSAVVVPLYPAIILASILLAFHSLGQALAGRATWKARRVG